MRPVETQLTLTNCLINRDVTEPNPCERAQTGFDKEIDFEARIAVAEIDQTALEHQPVAASTDGHARKPKFDDVPPAPRRKLGEDATADVPHQKVGIQVRGINEIVTQPALRPKAHFLDDWK